MINNLENILAVIAQRAYIKPETVVPLTAFSVDLSDATADEFDTVHVPKFTAGTAKEKTNGEAYVPDATGSTVPVALEKRLYSGASFTDISFERMSPQNRAELFAASAKKVVKNMIDGVNTLVAAVSKTTTFSPTFAGVAALKAYASGQAIDGELTLCLAPAQYDALVADSDVAKIAAIAGNADVFAKGYIDQLLGIRVVRLPAAPAETVGYLAPKSAIAVATRTTPLPSSGEGQIITDEATGLSFVHKISEEPSKASVMVLTELLYGAKLIDDTVIVKLTAAAQ